MKWIDLNKVCCAVSRRFRFRQICKAVGIKPYKWQRDFALKLCPYIGGPEGRATGKTTAVMLRLLLDEPASVTARPLAYMYFEEDPDWRPADNARVRWYYSEYIRLWRRCYDARIYPFYISGTSFIIEDGRHEGCGRHLQGGRPYGKSNQTHHRRTSQH